MSKERFEAWLVANNYEGHQVAAMLNAWQASKADSLQEFKGLVEALEPLTKRYEKARKLCLAVGNLHPDDKAVCFQALSTRAAHVDGLTTHLAMLLDDMMLALSAIEAVCKVVEGEYAQGGWRDISTAPRDGTLVLVYRPNAPREGRAPIITDYYKQSSVGGVEGWQKSNMQFYPPTHWQPLPTPPSTTPKQE